MVSLTQNRISNPNAAVERRALPTLSMAKLKLALRTGAHLAAIAAVLCAPRGQGPLTDQAGREGERRVGIG